jgi:hypothetical protein
MLAFEVCLEFGGATRGVHPDRPIYLHGRQDRLPTLTPRGFDWHKQPTWIGYLVERLEPD